MKKRAVIYIRVSDPSQVDNNSLETQEKVCYEYAKRNELEVDYVFREEGMSGKNTNRKALKDLLVFCYKNSKSLSAVIVYKYSRFSRNTENALELEAYLGKKGVEVLSATEPIGDNPGGRFMKTMIYAWGQMDNEIKGLIVKDNMKSVFIKGIWMWQCPVGYNKPYRTKEENKGKAPIINSGEAKIIIALFKDASTGIYSQKQLVDKVNLLGFKLVVGHSATINIIKKIITNTFYYGQMYCKTWNLYSQGLHEPLIAKELWEKANYALYGNTKKYKMQDSSIYPLKGLIKCAMCGKEMTSSNPKGRNKQYFHYECGNKICRKSRISTDEANTQFMGILSGIKPNERVIKLFNEMVFREWDKVINVSKNEIEAIDQQINSSKNELKIVAASLSKNIYSEELAREEADRLNAELLLLNIKRGDIKIEQYDAEKINNFTQHFLSNFDNLWLRLDELPMKQALQNKIFPNGIVCTEKKEIRTAGLSHCFELINTLNTSESTFGDPMGIRTPDLLAENQSS